MWHKLNIFVSVFSLVNHLKTRMLCFHYVRMSPSYWQSRSGELVLHAWKMRVRQSSPRWSFQSRKFEKCVSAAGYSPTNNNLIYPSCCFGLFGSALAKTTTTTMQRLIQLFKLCTCFLVLLVTLLYTCLIIQMCKVFLCSQSQLVYSHQR